jgi:hypothetical protein
MGVSMLSSSLQSVKWYDDKINWHLLDETAGGGGFCHGNWCRSQEYNLALVRYGWTNRFIISENV